MSQTITVEAVSDKFANKYSAGSVLAGGKWMQVSSKLDLADFKKDSQVTVETKTNDKGYTSIVGIVKSDVVQAVEQVIAETRTEAPTKTSKRVITEEVKQVVDDQYFIRNGYGKPMSQYEIDLDGRISRAGILQSCIDCPSLAGLPYTNTDELAVNITALYRKMIALVDQESN